MSDEVEVVTPQEGESAQQKPVSKYETQAIEMGWRPETEWEGDPEDFVPAKEYVQRKSFYDRISAQSGEIKELKKTLGEFSEHFKKVEDYTRKQVLEELKTAKKNALLDGNADEVIRIDEAITDFKVHEKELERQKEAKKVEADSNGLHPDFVTWQNANQWYQTDAEMTRYANMRAKGYVEEYGDNSPDKVLSFVEKEVRARFPDKFKNKKREAPAAVEGGSGGSKPAVGKLQASAEELAAAKKFVKMGVYKSEDDYIKVLRKMEKDGE